MRWICGFSLNERRKSAELKELLRLGPVHMMIRRSRLWWLGHLECPHDAAIYMTMEIDGTRPIRRPRKI